MQLERIQIVRNPSYHDLPDQFTGHIKFKTHNNGSIEIPLDHSLSEKVLRLCAESIVGASQDFAKALTATTLTQAQLESK